MFPRGEAGWGLGIKKGVLRQLPDAAPLVDDIGEVHDPPGGGAEVGITGEDLGLQDRNLGEAAVEEDGGVSTGGRTVTLRDFMAYYIFTRHIAGTTPKHLLKTHYLTGLSPRRSTGCFLFEGLSRDDSLSCACEPLL